MAEEMAALSERTQPTLTWDQGSEVVRHDQIAGHFSQGGSCTTRAVHDRVPNGPCSGSHRNGFNPSIAHPHNCMSEGRCASECPSPCHARAISGRDGPPPNPNETPSRDRGAEQGHRVFRDQMAIRAESRGRFVTRWPSARTGVTHHRRQRCEVRCRLGQARHCRCQERVQVGHTSPRPSPASVESHRPLAPPQVPRWMPQARLPAECPTLPRNGVGLYIRASGEAFSRERRTLAPCARGVRPCRVGDRGSR